MPAVLPQCSAGSLYHGQGGFKAGALSPTALHTVKIHNELACTT